MYLLPLFVHSNYIRLLGLPANIQQSVAAGHLSFGHARVLAGLQEPKNQKALYQRILDKGLNVRQTEREASDIVGRKPTKKVTGSALNLQMQTMRMHLRSRFEGRSLDMKVRSDGFGIDAHLALVRDASVTIDHAQVDGTGRYIKSNVVFLYHHRSPQLNVR